MEILFAEKKLEALCNSEQQIMRTYGRAQAKRLKQRLFDLRAAEVLSDLPHVPPMRCHELKGNRKGQFAVDLNYKYRIIFIPAINPVQRKKDGGIDRTKINAITIISIEDYHG